MEINNTTFFMLNNDLFSQDLGKIIHAKTNKDKVF